MSTTTIHPFTLRIWIRPACPPCSQEIEKSLNTRNVTHQIPKLIGKVPYLICKHLHEVDCLLEIGKRGVHDIKEPFNSFDTTTPSIAHWAKLPCQQRHD